MFSIIIPLYNKENYIKRTLDSIFNQTFSDFEIIIVNDGSTDKSLEIINNNFSDNRIKVISQDNSGVSAARNNGIKNAKYDYIAFLDADDTWHPKYLETICKLMEAYPEAGVYFTNYRLITRNNSRDLNQVSDLNPYSILVDDYFEFSIKNKSIWTSSVVVKKEIFENVGNFPIGYTRGEDLYLWTKIALFYKVAYTNKIRAFYFRDVPDSLTRRIFSVEKSFSNIAEDFYKKYKHLASNQENFREYMINIISSKAKYLIRMNKRKDARVLLRKYFNTKYNKKKIFALYIMSYMPSKTLDIVTK